MDVSHDATEQCRRLEGRLRVLSETTRAFAEATTDPQHLLDTVAQRVAVVLKDYCLVLLVSDDGQALIPSSVFSPDADALRQIRDVFAAPFLIQEHPVGRRVHESGEPFFAPQLDLQRAYPGTTPAALDFMQRIGMHSMLIVALRAHDRSLGQLVLARFRDTSPPFDENDLELAKMLADHAALAVSNAQLLSEVRREKDERMQLAERLKLLSEAAHEFSSTTSDLDRLLEVVARRLGELVGDLCAVRLVSADGAWLESTGAAHHRDPSLLAMTREVMRSGRQRIGQGLSGLVAATGKAVFTPQISTAELVASSEPQYRSYLERMGAISSITVPLVCQGQVVGIANLMRGTPDRPYSESDFLFVQSVADHAALAIGNARSYAASRTAQQIAEKATAAWREAETRFACLSEAGILGILVNRLSGPVREINDTLVQMVGYSREEIISGRLAWSDLTPPEWRDVDALAQAQLTTSGVGALREKEYLRKDGKRIPVLVGSALLDAATQECISFVLDLTELKSARVAIEQLRQQGAAEAHLAAIVGASDDAIIGKTLQGVITSWNEGAHRLFGYSAEEAVGQSIALLIPPGHEGEEEAILAAVARGDVKRFDAVRRRKDGSEIAVSVTSSPVRDRAGQVVGVAKVARDITERRRAEMSLALAKDSMEAANRELEAFSYSVAHDLRAPLRGMNGFAQVLREDYADRLDAAGLDCLEEISVNSRKMGALIDGLLSLSRVTRSDWSPEPVDLSALVATILAELAASEPQRAVRVVVQPGVSAEMDARLARALFENLLGNAWKFSCRTPEACIEFGAVDREGTRTLWVRDNGAGFDMEYASKLFAPFQRLHTVSEFPGTGIGLATVQRIVLRHGGHLRAEGRVGEGATFYLGFPIPSPGGS